MAESHSEDSPLLGATEPPSPGECSPGPSWSSPPPGRAWTPARRGSTGANFVHSQTSMDSGCDCDPSEGDAASHHPDEPPGGFVDPPPAGPSGGAKAPLAQRESLECRCGALEKRCVCGAASPVGEPGQGVPLSHTDRGELPPKVTFRIEGYDEEEENQNQR